MKSIPNTFTRFGDHFVLLEHDDENRLLIYERTNRAGVIRYELMRYRRATTANAAYRIEIGEDRSTGKTVKVRMCFPAHIVIGMAEFILQAVNREELIVYGFNQIIERKGKKK